jgi:hypothetical protein
MNSYKVRGVERAPTLFGDGKADDTEAFQWYLDNDVPIPDPPGGVGYLIRIGALWFLGIECA